MSGFSINFGQPDPEAVVGRDGVLADMYRHLERGSSIHVTGERRIGKSWILKRLVARPPENWVAVYTDVEQITSLSQLQTVLVERLTQTLDVKRRIFERLRKSGITEVRGIPIPQASDREPIDDLRRLIRGIARSKHRVILILDELPILAQRLEAERRGGGLELLQMLRALRIEEPKIRMVFAGSIGFHHLLADDVEISAAINDLMTVQIGPLALDAATALSAGLLLGIDVPDPDGSIAAGMAAASDGVPFYIQHIAADLERRRLAKEAVSASDVVAVRLNALTSGDDPWRMRHYDERLVEYFGTETPLARTCLTAVAFASSPPTISDITNVARTDRDVDNAFNGNVSDAAIRDVLRRLRLDHYLVLDSANETYRFSFTVVRDAWRELYR
jgi:uncharacterized protein